MQLGDKLKNVTKRGGQTKIKRVGLQFDPEMMSVLDRLKDETGIPSVDIVRRTLKFLDNTDDVVMREILGVNAKSVRVDVARLILERMSAGQDAGTGRSPTLQLNRAALSEGALKSKPLTELPTDDDKPGLKPRNKP